MRSWRRKVPEEPTLAEQEYVYMPRPHADTRADLKKVGGWMSGCRKCKAMMEGDQSRTNLAHGRECRARVDVLASDVEFRTNFKKADERKEGSRRVMEEFPRVQAGGSSSSGSAPVEPTAQPSP